jgi:hypothetical protein
MTDLLYMLRAFIATTQHKRFFINAIEAMSGINAGQRGKCQRTLRDCADSGPGLRKASPRIGPMAGDDVTDRCLGHWPTGSNGEGRQL